MGDLDLLQMVPKCNGLEVTRVGDNGICVGFSGRLTGPETPGHFHSLDYDTESLRLRHCVFCDGAKSYRDPNFLEALQERLVPCPDSVVRHAKLIFAVVPCPDSADHELDSPTGIDTELWQRFDGPVLLDYCANYNTWVGPDGDDCTEYTHTDSVFTIAETDIKHLLESYQNLWCLGAILFTQQPKADHV